MSAVAMKKENAKALESEMTRTGKAVPSVLDWKLGA